MVIKVCLLWVLFIGFIIGIPFFLQLPEPWHGLCFYSYNASLCPWSSWWVEPMFMINLSLLISFLIFFHNKYLWLCLIRWPGFLYLCEQFMCFACDHILLLFYHAASLHIDYPMLFELRNAATERVSHCGVLEFIAEEGMIYMPYWVSLVENIFLLIYFFYFFYFLILVYQRIRQ